MRTSGSGAENRKMADSLTDEQLVDELESYGQSVSLPIKPNKRPILIKKLNHLRFRNKPPQPKGKGKQPAPQRQDNLYAFSSDDSDTEMTPTPRPRFSPNSRHSQEPSSSSKISNVVTRSLRRRPDVGALSGTVRGRPSSDDRKSLAPRPTSAASASSVLQNESQSSRRSRRSETPEPDELSLNGNSYGPPRLYPDISAYNRGSTSKDTSFSDRSTVSFESSDSDVEGSSYEVENKSVNTSFGLLRGGRRTPTSNHVSPVRNTYSSRSLPETDQNHTSFKTSSSARGRARRRFYPEHISFGLVAMVLAFFVIIFCGYMFVRKELFLGWFSSDSSTQGKNSNYLLCSEKGEDQLVCYENAEVLKAKIIIKDLYSDLSARKGSVLCDGVAESEQRLPTIRFREELEQKKGLSGALDLKRIYSCCVDLIIENPGWNIRALTVSGEDAKTAQEVSYLESAVASMGVLCRLRRSFSRVMWSLFVLVAGVASLVVVLVLLYWRIQAKEKEEQKVFAMVEQIIDLLKEQHELSQNKETRAQPGLAVQHVRDQLLPPSRRKALQAIWDRAVKFISANESRVRLETEIIQGEEFDVWRWIQTQPNGGKVWQGQAFGEHNDSNTSNAIYSPTPCLKIRNMFDKEVESDDQWEGSVKDALLEKCQDVQSLVHIFVDNNSKEGCVYVKCDSKEAAGRVRQSLHGWWFDGRLVTVKHLKEDHYHHRWPEAKFAWRPLQPSTNQMRSLAQPYHRSSLEMT